MLRIHYVSLAGKPVLAIDSSNRLIESNRIVCEEIHPHDQGKRNEPRTSHRIKRRRPPGLFPDPATRFSGAQLTPPESSLLSPLVRWPTRFADRHRKWTSSECPCPLVAVWPIFALARRCTLGCGVGNGMPLSAGRKESSSVESDAKLSKYRLLFVERRAMR